MASALACGTTAPPTRATVDCGTFDAGHGRVDSAGLDCFWAAYQRGEPARWTVRHVTVEGDPLPSTIELAAGKVVITRDFSADKFSAPANRRVYEYRCDTLTKETPSFDPTRPFLRATGCTGDGPETTFVP